VRVGCIADARNQISGSVIKSQEMAALAPTPVKAERKDEKSAAR